MELDIVKPSEPDALVGSASAPEQAAILMTSMTAVNRQMSFFITDSSLVHVPAYFTRVHNRIQAPLGDEIARIPSVRGDVTQKQR